MTGECDLRSVTPPTATSTVPAVKLAVAEKHTVRVPLPLDDVGERGERRVYGRPTDCGLKHLGPGDDPTGNV